MSESVFETPVTAPAAPVRYAPRFGRQSGNLRHVTILPLRAAAGPHQPSAGHAPAPGLGHVCVGFENCGDWSLDLRPTRLAGSGSAGTHSPRSPQKVRKNFVRPPRWPAALIHADRTFTQVKATLLPDSSMSDDARIPGTLFELYYDI